MTLMTNVTAAVTAAEAALVADRAGRKIAPLWPLSSFVAVNPYLGLSGVPFAEAMAQIGASAGARMAMPVADYLMAVETGRINAEDLEEAALRHPEVASSGAALLAAADAAHDRMPVAHPTLLDLSAAPLRQALTTHLTDYLAMHFDAGQAHWAQAVPGAGLWTAWRADAAHDQSFRAMGLPDASARIAMLPDDPLEALAHVASQLGLSGAAFEAWATRLLYTISGWSGHARYRLWQAELEGGSDAALSELLSIRAVCDWLVQGAVPTTAWEEAKTALATHVAAGAPEAMVSALQTAFEAGWRRMTFAELGQASSETTARPPFQAAFCIDVRSEVFRRALETALPGIETIGFAGFFGAAVSYRPLGAATQTARCPVLLSPSGCAHDDGDAALGARRAERIAALSIWARFKQAAVAGFGYVETMGLGYAPRLLAQSFKASSALSPRHLGLSVQEAAGLAPSLSVFPEAARAETAATVLKAMSLSGPFARVVVLAGHGGQSLNNPHNAGLDCGACGGHDGEVNARLIARLLNDPAVRADLPKHGIEVPQDTVFVPALHDTTTDEITLFDIAACDPSHAEDLKVLKRALSNAGKLCRAERAGRFKLAPGASAEQAVAERARDWSQTRPEWALAGCTAFIAAPRGRTKGVDLGGRAFLHSYDWRADAANGYPVLELILTAPLIVASWINLQYYASTVDNRTFGAGNKVLHNVTGLVGVVEGSTGDLRTGLSLQSVHDGETSMHEPMRLHAVVEAPTEAMDEIVARHDGLRDLLDKGWVHLFQMDDAGAVATQYQPGGTWHQLGAKSEPAAKVA